MEEKTMTLEEATTIGKLMMAVKVEPMFADEPNRGSYRVFFTEAGFGFYINTNSYGDKGRIRVSGMWPSYKTNAGQPQFVTPTDVYVDGKRCEPPSITIASTKTEAQIVADITRRFLPGYRKMWDACLKLAAARQKYADVIKANAEFVASIMPEGLVGRECNSVSFKRGETTYIRSDGTFDIKLRDLTNVELLQIAAILKPKG